MEKLMRSERPETFTDYLKNEPLVKRAYEFAKQAHEGQYRIAGEPYINHCEAVVRIIYEEWGIKNNPKLIAAGFLHDTLEDTNETVLGISGAFGSEVAEIVEGVSKFRSAKKEDVDKETLRKVVGLAFVDWRVSILKLADRLHNMRTMDAMPPDKAAAKSRETLDVYSRLAQSLGMWQVYKELQDLSFSYVDPLGFREMKNTVYSDPRLDDAFLEHNKSLLGEILKQERVSAKIETRVNSLYRLQEKRAKVVGLNRINDLISFRVVVEDAGKKGRDECYRLLGVMRHFSGFYGIEDDERFDDFIAFPRENGYRALQITLDEPKRGAFEVAIMTAQMEEFNNWGVVGLARTGETELEKYILKLVFAPSGEVRFLPREATGIDFAYSIDERLGASASHILIDGKRASLSHVLPNGANVEVVRGEERIAPGADVLDFARPQTRKKIEAQLEAEATEAVRAKGKEKIEKILKKRGLLDLSDVEGKVKSLLFHIGTHGSLKNLYFKVGTGAISLDELGRELTKIGITKKDLGLTTVLVEGKDIPNILRDVTVLISGVRGNIFKVDHQAKGRDFSLRLVVEGLSKVGEARLLKKIQKDKRFKRSLVL